MQNLKRYEKIDKKQRENYLKIIEKRLKVGIVV